MRGVPWRVGDLQRPSTGRDGLAALQLAKPLAGNRQELAPQPIHVLAVETGGAREQPGRIREVRGATLVDEHLNRPVLLDETAGAPGMVQVDVGQQNLPDVRDPDTAALKGGAKRRQARRRSGINQRHTARPVEHGGRDDVRVAEKVEVDVVDAWGEADHRPYCGSPGRRRGSIEVSPRLGLKTPANPVR